MRKKPIVVPLSDPAPTPFAGNHFNRLRKAALEAGGSVEKRQGEIVTAIVSAFQSPDRWPITDAERIELLRGLYRQALSVRELERLSK